ncbi:SLATT domain-containing protein [Pectobacterium brasiliense]|uniref:SLATT domain-containing protein n=1 Tax=Pectobacterium brasiliense TaxID=180957 RepID=UPI0006921C7E|nr:SLATT domain-containing protein [Pectobacterium brasiliense]
MDEKKIIEIINLEIDCKIGKDRHFIAADRKNRWRIELGLFAVIGSAIISSGIGNSVLSLIGSYIEDKKIWDLWASFFSHVLPLLVGISTSIIGFLGLEKQTAQHRYVGNAYIEIARKTRALFNTLTDDNYETKIKEYDYLLEKYMEINKDGESCPTNSKDSKKAMEMNKRKRNAIKKKISDFESQELNLSFAPEKRKITIAKLASDGFRKIIVKLLVKFSFISLSQYRGYIKSLR